MFSGIIQQVETLKVFKDYVAVKNVFDSISPGESIAINGICLTVERIYNGYVYFSVGEETLKKTNIIYYSNRKVNLEKSIKLGSSVDGHMVYGHVDGVIKLLNVRQSKNTYWFKFTLPEERWGIVKKGSIALNGISLTVVNKDIDSFNVQVIEYTYKSTNLKYLRPGDPINYEIDIIIRYIKSIYKNIKK